MDPMDEIRQTFFQECEEQLVELESGLLAIEAGESDPETVNVVFRAVHSIKGGAGAFALTDLAQFAFAFEKALDGLRLGKFAADPALITILKHAADLLTDLVRSSKDGSPADLLPASQALKADLAQALADRGAAEEDKAPADGGFAFQPVMIDLSDFGDLLALPHTPTYQQIRFKPRPELYAKGNDTAILMRELNRLGTITVTCDVSDLPALNDLDPAGAYLSWVADLRGCSDATAVADILDFVEWDSDLTIEEIAEASDADLPPAPVPSKRASRAGRRKPNPAKRPAAASRPRHKSGSTA